jgi:effector-binding domain-containing protein
MISEPKIVNRTQQPYLAIRSQVAAQELPTVIPQHIGEVVGWLGQQGIAPSGAPFVRYNIINMPGMLDIEVGWPVASAVPGNGHIAAGSFPAGRYGSLIHTGDYPGLLDATAALLAWAKKKGLVWDTFESDLGDGFASRFESYLTNPEEEPDRAKHETEVTIKLAG